MSKRLRKRIRELCGLENVERSERRKRAQDILDSIEFKQKLCNRVPGLSFRDIDKTMQNVLSDNQPTTKEQEEREELKRVAPYKLDPDFDFRARKRATREITYEMVTKEEARRLVEASERIISHDYEFHHREYDTYTPEEVAELMGCEYQPTKFKRRRRKKKG